MEINTEEIKGQFQEEFSLISKMITTSLEMNEKSLQEKYQHYTISHIRTKHIGYREESIRIYLREHQITLSFQLDKQGYSNTCYLFPDALSEDQAGEYILYLNEESKSI